MTNAFITDRGIELRRDLYEALRIATPPRRPTSGAGATSREHNPDRHPQRFEQTHTIIQAVAASAA